MTTLTYSILHEEKLVIVQVQEETQPGDVQAALLAIVTAGALPYRKLIDLSFAPLTLGLTGVRAIKALTLDAGGAGRNAHRGPAAIVVGSELAGEMVEMFDEPMRLDRPLRVFRDLEAARQWLDEIAALETIRAEALSS